MTIDTVVFDLGGVVVDWDPKAFVQHALADDEMRQSALVHIIGHEDWLALDRGTMDVATATQRFVNRSGIPTGLVNAILAQVPPFLTTKEDTVKLINAVRRRGLRTLFLSNMHHTSIDYLERHGAFWPSFEGGIVSCRVGSIKPEPEIFQALFDRYELTAQRSVLVDDMQVNVDAARDLGMHGIVFESALQTRDALVQLLAD